MDGSISEQKQYLVGGRVGQALHIPHKLFQEWSKECWSTKSNLWQVLSISSHDVLDADDLWVLWISIKSKAVIHCINAHVSGDSSEPKCRETLVCVIWLDHHAHIEKSALILIVGSQIVKGVWLTWSTIGCGEINSSNERYSPARSQVVYKVWLLHDVELNEFKLHLITYIIYELATSQLLH